MRPAIIVENISKKYHTGNYDARDHVTRVLSQKFMEVKNTLLRRQEPTVAEDPTSFWALDDISFQVEPGEVVGIIGANGAGKSTLLKILSRITAPTSGIARVYGKLNALLEVGTGFHPDFTGRENIYMNATIMGLTRSQIDSKFDEIVAFSEVEKFIDTPIKHYSSGMYMRLAFSVAAHMEPDILLVDEVLAVGDTSFQKKSLGKMKNEAMVGRTVIFVSHSIPMVLSLCSRVIWIDNGKVKMNGKSLDVVNAYLDKVSPPKEMSAEYPVNEAMDMQFLRSRVTKEDDNEDTLWFECDYVVRRSRDTMMICVEVFNSKDVSVFYANDSTLDIPLKRRSGTHKVRLRIPAHILAPDEYTIRFGFWEPNHNPLHAPPRLWFEKRVKVVPSLTSVNVSWPSVIYLPKPRWQHISYSEEVESKSL